MVGDAGDGVQSGNGASPLPIPELGEPEITPVTPEISRPTGPEPEVTDEDRQTYGRLLDSAMERGLLSAYEYETRLGDLAGASTVDEMKKIVTELPIFTASTPAKPRRPSRSIGSRLSGSADDLPLVPGLDPAQMSGVGRHSRSNRWTKLIILLIVVIVLFVALSVYAAHLTNNHSNHTGASVTRTTLVVRSGNPSGTTTLRL
ncbi:MAG TPA: DUF1707 domain-containing protein [Acidimicrobiales bacterium]|nr:DUF1707 domain-containing protein [Acidimicrobiales bacterium]